MFKKIGFIEPVRCPDWAPLSELPYELIPFASWAHLRAGIEIVFDDVTVFVPIRNIAFIWEDNA